VDTGISQSMASTVLAWLIGRDSGGSLLVTGDDPVRPALPAWR